MGEKREEEREVESKEEREDNKGNVLSGVFTCNPAAQIQ